MKDLVSSNTQLIRLADRALCSQGLNYEETGHVVGLQVIKGLVHSLHRDKG